MTEQELKIVTDLMRQNETILEMNWQLLQAIVPVDMDEDDGSVRMTLQ